MSRRTAVLALIAFVLLTAAVVIFVVRNGADDAERSLQEGAAERLMPDVCQLLSLVEQQQFSKANNLFYDDVHQNAHILGSLVMERDRAVGARLLRSKAAVELDFRTLAPALTVHVPEFAESVRESLRTAGLSGSEFPCS